MPNIKLKDLDGYLQKKLEVAVMKCAKIAEIKLKNDIMAKLYGNSSSFDPKEYERTYDFLESVSLMPMVNKGQVSVMIYYDTSKITPKYTEANWNQHEDVWGVDVSQFIPLWIEEGTSDSLWDREGIYAMEGLEIYLRTNYKNMLKRELQKQGLKIK